MKSMALEVCTGTGCCLLGAQDLLAAIEALPEEIRCRIRLSEPACLKSCRQGPSILVDGTLHSGMTPDRLREIIIAKLD